MMKIYWGFGYDLCSEETAIDQKWELYLEKIVFWKAWARFFYKLLNYWRNDQENNAYEFSFVANMLVETESQALLTLTTIADWNSKVA